MKNSLSKINMRNYLFLLLILLFSVSISTRGSERFYFSNLSLENGLSQITITCIHQDTKGYMWFGTRNGLNRFDGYSFDVFTYDVEDDQTISDNHILCIAEDAKGNLWIGTNNGLNYLDLSTNKFKRYYNKGNDPSSLSNNSVYSIYFDEKERLWVGTSYGLDLYNTQNDSFEHIGLEGLTSSVRINAIAQKKSKLYVTTAKGVVVIYDLDAKSYKKYENIAGKTATDALSVVKTILIDKQDNLWLGTQGAGVFLMKADHEDFISYNQKNGLTNDKIRALIETPSGNVIAATFNGFDIIDAKTGEISQYKEYGLGQGMLSHYSITCLYYDRSQTLWVGTYAGGICFSNRYAQKFRFYNTNVPDNILGIMGPVEETDKYIYVATEGGGLLEMEKDSGKMKNYEIQKDANYEYANNIIKSLYLDGNKIFCGTNIGTIYSYDLHTKKFTLFYDVGEEVSIYFINKCSTGELVFGGVGQSGFNILTKNKKLISEFPLAEGEKVSFLNTRCFLKLDDGKYLLGTRNAGIYYYDSKKQVVKNYRYKKNDSQSIPDNFVTDIIKTSDDEIWVGTYGGGISKLDIESGRFTTYNTKSNLLNNNVCKIVEDKNKNLWVCTITGVSKFDKSTGEFINYTHSNGIKIDEFTPHAGTKLSDGNIIFTGNNGITIFDPERMTVNPFVPPIVFKNLYINNDQVIPGDETQVLSEQLDIQRNIELNYSQTNISIEYSALNYVFSDQNQYIYKLEGFDKDWNRVGNRRIAYYTNLPAGEYKFIVRGSNNDDVWNDEGASLNIIVNPPYWKTWWAYAIYILFVLIVIYLVIKYLLERKRLQDDIKMKQAEAKAQEEFHQARSKLFTNFSHELRTPLTLIMSPLEDMATENLPPKTLERVNLMQNNARRLLRIVNNLMDFQKNESGTMRLKISEGDFVKFTKEMILFFRELALSRKIQFRYNHSMDSLQYWFDSSLMEKVYFNLLSNAFKNVPNQGEVEVNMNLLSLDDLRYTYADKSRAFHDDKISYLVVEIKNTGEEIAEEELENIFIPFYQVAQNENSASGTGLGLSLSKSIVEMHHGNIWADNLKAGGVVFRYILPIDKNLYREEDFVEEYSVHSDFPYSVDVSKNQETDTISDKQKHTVLVVEDNVDVRTYLISHLKDKYNILEAANGEEAIAKAVKSLPDLIISDLMMPKMDGMEMCSILKQDINTSHIPVIMLTAKTMDEDIKKGYELGADDYITKPFSTSLLLTRVENIIVAREKLKELYGKHFSLETLGVETTSVDERFMQKLYEILEANISNPEFSLDEFSRDINMSRASLYRKIKSITNLSPNEFIRNFRLTMAGKILKETQMPISEVYVAVGFNSHAYFSNCFKTFYGVSPTEYMSKEAE